MSIRDDRYCRDNARASSPISRREKENGIFHFYSSARCASFRDCFRDRRGSAKFRRDRRREGSARSVGRFYCARAARLLPTASGSEKNRYRSYTPAEDKRPVFAVPTPAHTQAACTHADFSTLVRGALIAIADAAAHETPDCDGDDREFPFVVLLGRGQRFSAPCAVRRSDVHSARRQFRDTGDTLSIEEKSIHLDKSDLSRMCCERRKSTYKRHADSVEPSA